ncbi:MAG: hypothetical protein IKS30_04785 [Treponema sp.]|nr:hypothetical protein [Treponema sp.]
MNISRYHSILCPDAPDFLQKYLSLPLLTRLKGIGLLCGTDFTALYKNTFFYSRFDHSLGCALIAWNFTRDKKQCIASLLHDVSTAVFSHTGDFRKGDTLRQEVTEGLNESMILNDRELAALLAQDGLTPQQVCDYHVYPVCDNEIPALSSDRLEYMFPSGCALREGKNAKKSGSSAPSSSMDDDYFDMDSIERCYSNIKVLKNEKGIDELGFTEVDIALEYTRKFLSTAILLQHNENKLALNMLGSIMNMAVQEVVLREGDFMTCSEKQIIGALDTFASKNTDSTLSKMIRTWRQMNRIEHLEFNPGEGFYSVHLDVKKRWINPLVKTSSVSTERINRLNPEAARLVKEFLSYRDSAWGAVKLM